MANTIKLKRSSVAGKKPSTSDLELGELGLNTFDGKIFTKTNRSGLEEIVRIGSEEPGNTYFVSKNGNDTHNGKSLGNSFATIKYALSIANSGDTIEISSGTYTEIFPLEIPIGVSVKGKGIRSTFIQPTENTKDLDCFLLNGETEVTDLTIGNFYYNSSNDTGYGFRFKSGMITTSRSPYIQRVTVLNKGSIISSSDPFGFDTPNNPPVSYIAGRGAKIDGSVVSYNTLEPAILFNECTFICPNSVGLVMTNGARTEWVNCFTYFCDKGIDAYDGASGLGGIGKTRIKINGITQTSAPSANDLLYYLEGNAKSGTYSRAGTTITITYNSHGLSNGDKIYADFTSGTATDNYYTISNVSTNTFDVTDTVSGSTSGNVSYKKALAYGSISTYSSGTIKLTDKGTGLFETAASRSGKSVTAFGDAKISTAQYKFGISSLVLDGTGDYIFVPSDTDFAYGTGDFTVEFWYYRVGSGVFQVLFDHRTAATDVALMVAVNSSNQIYTYINGSIRNQGTTALVQNTWYHIAVSRTNGSTRLFINGTQEGATYSDTNNYPAKQIRMGADYAGNGGVNGYIDEVRVSNSSRYSGTFTPSTIEFVSDSNTKLLLKFEGANNSVIIKDSTLQIQDIRIASTSGDQKLTATGITLADYQEFGASMRSIGSAAIFGNKGIVGNGPGVNLRLFAFNFGHIGSGKDFSQDESLVVQANEVIDTNSANIQYVSIDQNGDFRVGDAFYVNEKKGIVSFGGQTFNISSLSNLDVTDGTNVTSITPTSITTGTIRLNSNTISTTSGDLTIDPAGTGKTTIVGDLQITGALSTSLSSSSSISQGDSQITITDTGSNGTLSFVADGNIISTITSSGVSGNNFIPTSSIVPTNGLYLPSANTLGLATNSTGRVFVNDSGNVGIGNTNPGEKLDVTGNIQASQLISTITTGTAPLIISSTTQVANLNAQYLNGLLSSSSNTISTIVARDSSGNFSAGTITATSFSGSGSSLTSLTADNLIGTIPSGVLGNSSLNIGTTSVALNRASANLDLTGISSVAMPGSTSGTITLQPTATAGTNTITLPATTGTIITTGDTGTVTGTMIADGTIADAEISASASIAITKLAASTISGISLGNNLSSITFNNGGAGDASGTTYNGGTARTISYNSIGASPLAGSSSLTTTGSVTSGTWSSGLSGETFSTTNNVIAGTNAQGQGALTSDYNIITTASNNPSGVTLPVATQGRRIIIVNRGANPVNVYPATGGAIDALGSNISISLAVGAILEFDASSTTQWYSNTNIALNASQISTGTVPTARLGSGTANSTTYLRGDSTWATVTSGITISDDTSTNATRYPTFTSATSGSISSENTSSTKLTYNPSTGTFSATIFSSLSDASLKENIKQIKNATNIVKNLRGVRYDWIDGEKNQIGVIAQEIEKVIPEVVKEADGVKSVAYSNIVALLIEAIKEQQIQIENLEKKINA